VDARKFGGPAAIAGAFLAKRLRIAKDRNFLARQGLKQENCSTPARRTAMRLLDRTRVAIDGGVLARIPKLGLAAVLAAAALSLGAADAHARGRGNSAMTRFYRQAWQKQAQEMSKQMAADQKAQQEKQAAFMKRFDTNGNGKIDGKEKAAANRYLRELELGKNPDKGYSSGFSAQPSSSSSSKPKAKK
jgi:hypothetical protein